MEHRIPNTRHAVRYFYARKFATTTERTIPDTRPAFYCDIRKTATTVERLIPDARYSVRYRDTRKFTATVERAVPDTRYAVVDRYYTVLAT